MNVINRIFKSGLLTSLILVSLVSCGIRPVRTVLRDVTIIRGDTTIPNLNQTIIIQGDSIVKIVPNEEYIASRNDKIIKGKGLYAMPGLWDAYVHLSKIKEDAMPVFVTTGITSVRDMGSDFSEVEEMRKRIMTSVIHLLAVIQQ